MGWRFSFRNSDRRAPDGTYEHNNLFSVSSRFDQRKSIEEQKAEVVKKNISVPMQTARSSLLSHPNRDLEMLFDSPAWSRQADIYSRHIPHPW
jgi:hypothetical protein